MLPEFQSAYRRRHWAESTLVRVFSDILDATDAQQVTSLRGRLDLDAALDTVAHDALLRLLESSFGVCGTPMHHPHAPVALFFL